MSSTWPRQNAWASSPRRERDAVIETPQPYEFENVPPKGGSGSRWQLATGPGGATASPGEVVVLAYEHFAGLLAERAERPRPQVKTVALRKVIYDEEGGYRSVQANAVTGRIT